MTPMDLLLAFTVALFQATPEGTAPPPPPDAPRNQTVEETIAGIREHQKIVTGFEASFQLSISDPYRDETRITTGIYRAIRLPSGAWLTRWDEETPAPARELVGGGKVLRTSKGTTGVQTTPLTKNGAPNVKRLMKVGFFLDTPEEWNARWDQLPLDPIALKKHLEATNPSAGHGGSPGAPAPNGSNENPADSPPLPDLPTPENTQPFADRLKAFEGTTHPVAPTPDFSESLCTTLTLTPLEHCPMRNIESVVLVLDPKTSHPLRITLVQQNRIEITLLLRNLTARDDLDPALFSAEALTADLNPEPEKP